MTTFRAVERMPLPEFGVFYFSEQFFVLKSFFEAVIFNRNAVKPAQACRIARFWEKIKISFQKRGKNFERGEVAEPWNLVWLCKPSLGIAALGTVFANDFEDYNNLATNLVWRNLRYAEVEIERGRKDMKTEKTTFTFKQILGALSSR